MMWCMAAPILNGKVRCTVVDTKGAALPQAVLSFCQVTFSCVWCTYTTKPIMWNQNISGAAMPNRKACHTGCSKASASAVMATAQTIQNATTRMLSQKKTGRRVGMCVLFGKNSRFHQISIM